MRFFAKLLSVFVSGGLVYGTIEVLSRGYTFISMGIIGGVCMVVIHLMNDERRNGTSLIAAISVSWVFIISIELLSGEILNRILKLHIWSYSRQPLNFDGQICLVYAVLWYVLAFVGIAFDEYVINRIIHKKHYALFVNESKAKEQAGS